jgi:hypothetical protein
MRRGARLHVGRELERVMGIEPTLEAWEAPVLPLNYTRREGQYREESSALASARLDVGEARVFRGGARNGVGAIGGLAMRNGG